MTSNHHAPYVLGYTCYNGWYRGKRRSDPERIPKAGRSSDRRLQLACVKSGIASNRGSAYRGEYVPGPCTHRPSHHESLQHPKPVTQPAREGAVEGGADDWVKS